MRKNPVSTVLDQPLAPSRRAFLRGVGGALAAAAVLPGVSTADAIAGPTFGLTDGAIGARGGLAVFEAAAAIGAGGVEIDFARLGTRSGVLSRLTSDEGRQHFIDAAGEHNQTICSLAFGAWRKESFAGHPQAVAFTRQAIDAARSLGVRTLVLPIGQAEDLAIPELHDRCIDRLRTLAPLAESAGVVLALESDRSPLEMRRTLNAVNSSAVAAAVSATPVAGLSEAFDVLGGHRIAQIRFSSEASTDAGQQLRDACRAANWAGWVVIDRLPASAGDFDGPGARAIAALSGALSANHS